MVDPRRTGSKPPTSSFFFLFFFSVVVLSSLFVPTFQQGNSTTGLSSELDFLALYSLRSSLGIRSRDWPRKSDPCRNWTGILCEDGRVVGIDVSGFRRTRLGSQNPNFVVDALGNLTRLRSFNASRLTLAGTIPEWFGQRLVSVRSIDLSSCSVSGSIPFSLGGLTNLTGLYLSRNNLTGSIPSSIGNMSSLSVLDLSFNSLTGSIPSSLSNLTSLEALDLSSNSLLGSIPQEIGALSRLRTLNLSRNSLTSAVPAPLGNLAGLVDLDLGYNSLSGTLPPELRGLRSLKRLFIGDNLLRDSLPDNLFDARSQLEVIVLKHNDFAGEFPGQILTLSVLLFVDLSGNNFTGQLPNSTSNATAAAVLNISGNSFYGTLSPSLLRFISVDLSKNFFQGSVPDFLPGNASLAGNCLRDSGNQRNQSDCQSFYTEKGLTFDNFGVPSPAQPRKKSHRRRTIILAAVLGGVGLIILSALLVALILLLLRRKRSSGSHRGVGVGPVPPAASPARGVSVSYSSVGDSYTHAQLLQATADFADSNLVKNGRSGDLYKGVLENGVPVIVKRIDLRSVKKEGHAVELDFFAKVSHARFVPFLGHCLEEENQKFLVYKYMPNGDLSSSLYRKTKAEEKKEEGLKSLDWITRLKIALGAAEGLSYLHHECNPPLVHRDVQASSILLDDKFEVRLGSLSEVCAQEGDTHQSKITRLLRLQQSSEQGSSSASQTAVCSYDVYCFGKVLLELVTGKLGISGSSDAQTKEWMEQTLPYISIYEKDLVTKILDPSLLVDEDLLEEVWAMAVVARSCLNPKPNRRPPMRYVLKALENPLKVVREDNSGSARLRTTSSRGSWNAALFGSWRSSSDVTAVAGPSRLEKNSTGSREGDQSSSRRRNSKEIFPEPSIVQDIERLEQA